VLSLGAAASAAAFWPRRGGAQELPVLKIAYQPYEYSGQVLYAQDLGFFTKAGLKAELQSIPFGAALATAVASNAVDIGTATITTLVIAHSKGIPFTIVAPAALFSASRPATGYLMVGNQTNIRTGKDMNGKVVGTPGLATVGEYGVRYWVDKHGGDSTTLKFQELPFSQMPAAFANGRIDAAFIGEPYLSEARKVARPLAREMDEIARDFLITCWFTTTAWATSHPDLVTRFNNAVRDASIWAVDHPDECIRIIGRDLNADTSQMQRSTLSYFPPQITTAMVQPLIDLTAKYLKFPAFPAQELIYSPRG
jgi:NitT/TauT family transport system substrate-binding protein